MIYIGIDDTDNAQCPHGTGRVARAVARELKQGGLRVKGITRHQLLNDPRVPMTVHNSCSAIHVVDFQQADLAAIGESVSSTVRGLMAEGSDPGVCVAQGIVEAAGAFGARAKVELVDQAEARKIARKEDLYLVGLGGTEDGVIGALSAVGLAATWNDGRYTMYRRIRSLQGVQSIQAIVEAGIDAVVDEEGHAIESGEVETDDRLRPSLRDGKAILYVRRQGERYAPLKKD